MDLRRYRLFNWFFYGHLQIALAAAGLGWLSLRLAFGDEPEVNEWPVLTLLFFATLGVYTLHRYLSFQRAGERPATERYNIVSRHPTTSLVIGISSIVTAGIVGIPYLDELWHNLLWAVPITIFYLTPPIRGWKRLRDIPFVKVIWVGIAWQIMTNEIPVDIVSHLIDIKYQDAEIAPPTGWGAPATSYSFEIFIRLSFTCAIAILFDFRDIVLDRSQKVKTIANNSPKLARFLVTALMILNISVLLFSEYGNGHYPALGSAAYLAVIIIAWTTHEDRPEWWYAVVINGLLLAPVLAMLLAL